MQDFSIDLETADNRYSSAILAIGVCQFDRNTGQTGKTFYRELYFKNSARYGTVGADTITWWMEQSDEARKLFTRQFTKDKCLLPRALTELAAFIPKGARVWGNGATFDITILEHAYSQIAQQQPWEFWNIRDMRTAVDMADYQKNTIPFAGTAHNALDDATHHAKVISWCFNKVHGPVAPEPEDDLV